MKKSKKMYKGGGFMATPGLTNGAEVGAGATNMLVDMFDKPNKFGRQTGLGDGLKKGAQFASMGASIGGPWGAAIGGAVGLSAGLIGSIGAKDKEAALNAKLDAQASQDSIMTGMNKIQADPESLTGSKYAQNFAFGGNMGGTEDPLITTKKENVLTQSNWDTVKNNKDMKWTSPDTYMNWVDGWAHPDEANVAKVAATAWRKTPGATGKFQDITVDSGRSNPSGGGTGSRLFTGEQQKAADSTNFVSKYRTDNNIITQEQINNKQKKLAGIFKNGGDMDSSSDMDDTEEKLEPMSSNSVEVKGPSHEQGGVDLPNGAEVEGDETIKNNYVFSKELGFAQQHKPIAKAIGKLEEKRETEIRKNTLHALQQREQQLALKQETVKKILGL